jgi:hypothetical protein
MGAQPGGLLGACWGPAGGLLGAQPGRPRPAAAGARSPGKVRSSCHPPLPHLAAAAAAAAGVQRGELRLQAAHPAGGSPAHPAAQPIQRGAAVGGAALQQQGAGGAPGAGGSRHLVGGSLARSCQLAAPPAAPACLLSAPSSRLALPQHKALHCLLLPTPQGPSGAPAAWPTSAASCGGARGLEPAPVGAGAGAAGRQPACSRPAAGVQHCPGAGRAAPRGGLRCGAGQGRWLRSP